MSLAIFLKKCHLSFVPLQAGNVVTGEMVEELLLSGADIIKVGIGPGMYVYRYYVLTVYNSRRC